MGNCISSQDDVKNANRVTVSLYILIYLGKLNILLGVEIHMDYLIMKTKMLLKKGK